ncbi:MAG TPA: DUF1269 domain-containing protein, partial [Micromonosporaceae bacterium]|nr:DUF1269 domain-containing protein [Micromonosporaceae bacterium]
RALTDGFWGLLFGLAFLDSAAAPAELGVDDLVQRLRADLVPGSSALIVLGPADATDRLRDAFAGPEPPELNSTSLTNEQRDALREMFAGEPAPAPALTGGQP